MKNPPEKLLTVRTFDARTWAKSFNETLVELGYQPHDEGWLISWFANAIMCGYDEAKRPVSKDCAWPEKKELSPHLSVGADGFVKGYNQAIDDCKAVIGKKEEPCDSPAICKKCGCPMDIAIDSPHGKPFFMPHTKCQPSQCDHTFKFILTGVDVCSKCGKHKC